MSRFGNSNRTTLLMIATSLAVLPLAACSSSEPVAGPDVDGGSCLAAAATMNDALSEAKTNAPNQVRELLTGGTLDTTTLVDPVLKSLDEAAVNETDPDVVAAIGEARSVWDNLDTEVQGLDSPESLSDLRSYREELTTILSELEEAGSNLEEACATQ